MSDNPDRKLYSPAHIATLTVNGIGILLGIFITIFYISCKVLHTYPCYNKLTVNLIILLDNIIRIIPLGITKDGEYEFWKGAQAFLLIFFDKFFLIILTNQILIQYFGIMHTNFYFKHEKKIFFIGTILSAIISIILASIFIGGGYESKSDKLYFYGKNDLPYKKSIDTIYNSILLVINVICLVIIMINSSAWNKKSKKEGMDNIYYEHNFIQALIKFLVNTLTYVISFLIIYRCLSGYGITDLIYLINCLIVNIVYCFNKFVNNAFCNTFCICIYKNLPINQQNVKKSDTYNIMNDEDDDDDDDY